MRLYYEWGRRQLHKGGEELCGDSIAVSRGAGSVTVALADGLGSGVKANILATLTNRIAIHMLENELPLGEVVRALSETLPVCGIRKLAYSTFAIAQFFSDGRARIVEFDSPTAMILRSRQVKPVPFDEREIGGKTIRESTLDLHFGDWIVLVSDGVLNAGIGGVYPLGWGWNQAARFLEKQTHPGLCPQDVADRMADAVRALYDGPPGDDVSVVVIRARKKLLATVFTGPPADRTRDEIVVSRFLGSPGHLVVCGGTTAKIVASHLGNRLEVELANVKPNVPPTGRIEGIDLVTEGILTLTRACEILRSGAQKAALQFQTDGASALVRELLNVDHVHFTVGKTVNPAHQNPDLPHELGIRMGVVRELADELRGRNCEVTIEEV